MLGLSVGGVVRVRVLVCLSGHSLTVLRWTMTTAVSMSFSVLDRLNARRSWVSR